MKVATYNLSKIMRNAWYLKKSQPQGFCKTQG